MELDEIKRKIGHWHQNRIERDDVVTLITALPQNGDVIAEALEYVDLVYQAAEAFPEIIMTNRHLKDRVADTIAAIQEANQPPTIFEHGAQVVRITQDEHGIPFIEPLSESACRGFMERAARYTRVTKTETLPYPAPPLDIVQDYMALPPQKRNLQALSGIIEIPVVRPDGSIVTEAGYDKSTGLYYQPAPELVIPPMADKPTQGEVKKAVALIQEPIVDFPFDTEASKANAIAAMMTPIYRPMIPGPTPLCLIDKPQAGTGASLLTEVIATIATGRSAAMMSAPTKEEEWDKRLHSILLGGATVITIDNVEGTLRAPALAVILTSYTVVMRILGQSKMVRIPNRATYIATGNNVRLAGDLPRRIYYSRLDARNARPWMRDPRSFKYQHLLLWVRQNRGILLAALLTLARGWITAGKPSASGLPNLGGYEDWTETIGGVLAFAGIGGFLGNLELLYSRADVETAQWEGFLEAWQEALGEEPVTVDEVVRRMKEEGDLSGALPENIDRDPKKINRSLGGALGKRVEMRFPNGLMIIKGPVKHHATSWQVGSYRGANSPDLATKGELGELQQLPTRKRKKTEKNMGVDINSPNSLLATKSPNLEHANSPEDLWAGMPDFPHESCPTCGGADFWPDFKNKRFVCCRCHPDPGGEK